VGVAGEIEVLLHVTTLVHKGHVAVLGKIGKLPLGTVHGRGNHVVGGGADLDVLAAGEHIKAGDVGLGVAVFSGLGHGDGDDLAWLALQADEVTLADLTSTDGDGLGGTSSGGSDAEINLLGFGLLLGLGGLLGDNSLLSVGGDGAVLGLGDGDVLAGVVAASDLDLVDLTTLGAEDLDVGDLALLALDHDLHSDLDGPELDFRHLERGGGERKREKKEGKRRVF